MGVTPELKAMLESRAAADRRELEANRAAEHAAAKDGDRTELIMLAIDKAAPFLDAGQHDQTKWPPSAQLKLGYFVVATSDLAGGDLRAERFVGKTLERARDLYRAGFYANPFAKEPAMRENA